MKVELAVDGKAVQMNSFTQNVSGKVILAIVESLHDVDLDWKSIVIQVYRDETSD
ncbi:MAG: hypothetical protein ACXQT4_06790 [Methanotrichaceae archaeon]